MKASNSPSHTPAKVADTPNAKIHEKYQALVTQILSQENASAYDILLQSVHEKIIKFKEAIASYTKKQPIGYNMNELNHFESMPDSIREKWFQALMQSEPLIQQIFQDFLESFPKTQRPSLARLLKKNLLSEAILISIPLKLQRNIRSPKYSLEDFYSYEKSKQTKHLSKNFLNLWKKPSKIESDEWRYTSLCFYGRESQNYALDANTKMFHRKDRLDEEEQGMIFEQVLNNCNQVVHLELGSNILTDISFEVLDCLFEKCANVEVLSFPIHMLRWPLDEKKKLFFRSFPKVQKLQLRRWSQIQYLEMPVFKTFCERFSRIEHLDFENGFANLTQEIKNLLLTSFWNLRTFGCYDADIESFNIMDQMNFLKMVERIENLIIFEKKSEIISQYQKEKLWSDLSKIPTLTSLMVRNDVMEYSQNGGWSILPFVDWFNHLKQFWIHMLRLSKLSVPELKHFATTLGTYKNVACMYVWLDECTLDQLQAFFEPLGNLESIDLRENPFFLSNWYRFSPWPEYPEDKVRALRTIFWCIQRVRHIYWGEMHLAELPKKSVKRIFESLRHIETFTTSEEDKKIIEKYVPRMRGKIQDRDADYSWA